MILYVSFRGDLGRGDPSINLIYQYFELLEEEVGEQLTSIGNLGPLSGVPCWASMPGRSHKNKSRDVFDEIIFEPREGKTKCDLRTEGRVGAP